MSMGDQSSVMTDRERRKIERNPLLSDEARASLLARYDDVKARTDALRRERQRLTRSDTAAIAKAPAVAAPAPPPAQTRTRLRRLCLRCCCFPCVYCHPGSGIVCRTASCCVQTGGFLCELLAWFILGVLMLAVAFAALSRLSS